MHTALFVFLFSVFLVLDKVKWHMGHTNRQEGALRRLRDEGMGANEVFCFLVFVFALNSYLEALNPC